MTHHRAQDITWPHAADNGDSLTYDEGRAIRALQALAEDTEAGFDGRRTPGDQERRPRFDGEGRTGPERQECVLADIYGIPNDGGAW